MATGRIVFALLLVGSVGTSSAVGTNDESNQARPNVVFLAIDDLNDWVGFLGGYPAIKTPNLDRLAARGVVFEHAYCAAPACNPSRVSLLTGLRPSTTGIYVNPQPWRPVLPDVVTLPQHFMAGGYRVLGGGKIFHGKYNDLESWDEYFQSPGNKMPDNRPLSGIPKTGHFDWGPIDLADQEMGDHKVVDWAIEQLRESADQPLFLAVGIYRPHLPWYVPKRYFDEINLDEVVIPEVPSDDLDDLPEPAIAMARPDRDHRRVVENDQWRHAIRGYLASIAFTDWQVGRLLDAIDASPIAENTIIVMWGDHGWHLGEKEHWRKFALWEEATRVPFVIAAPRVASPGGRCARTVSLLDIYPTLADLCGLPAKSGLEGKSLRPLLDDPQARWDHPIVTTHGKDNHAVRSERWRYIHYKDGSEELYDHKVDPMEWQNLARDPEYRTVIDRLSKSLPTINAPDAPRDK